MMPVPLSYIYANFDQTPITVKNESTHIIIPQALILEKNEYDNTICVTKTAS